MIDSKIMCYTIPGKITKINGKKAIVEYFGEEREILNEFSDIKEGDFVYAQGGYLINKVPEEEALESLKFWKENFKTLKELDKNLAVTGFAKPSDKLIPILKKIQNKKEVSKKELLALLETKDKQDQEIILKTANQIRQQIHSNASCVHGIIEFSNYCRNNCYYCGIRKDAPVERYRLSPDEIIEIGKKAAHKYNFKALVLQSGEDLWYTEEKLSYIIQELRKENLLLFVSLGIRPKETYQKLFAAGARGVLMRFETANQKIFDSMRPQTDFETRIQLIKDLQKIGYIVATGFLVGLPNETNEDIVDNILLTKELQPEMFSFGPLIPSQDTPLKDEPPVKKETMLKIIALTRFAEPDANILVTTALETLDEDAKKEGLMAGANSLMINVTPDAIRNKYHIYDNRAQNDKDIQKNIDQTIKLMQSLGRAPSDIGLK
ncbi:[FeFe] hydrogenase H-cluster radical SAM maturase HydE [Patescibacteria group bacterium]|nr:[FeFe] hydrogenase H-cluster radical SAM maturase HydE [Patescibacteria group bacterium]